MVDITLKLVGEEVDISTPSTVHNSTFVRVYAPTSDAVITYTSEDDVVIGSMTIPAGFVEIMEKNRTEKLSANTTVLATPLAIR